MINRLITVSLLAGLCAGLFVAVLQHFSATPLILKAETFENAEKAVSTLGATPGIMPAVAQQQAPALLHLAHSHENAAPKAAPSVDHAHGEDEGWKPENGLPRTAFTTLVTVGTAISFAFLLIGAMLATGANITMQSTLAYAAAAFFAFGLAPAAGLAPELPGSASAALEARQVWWLSTVLASAGGLWLLLKSRSGWLGLLGVALLLAPHVIGAPHPVALESKVPAEIAARFTGLSIVLQGVLWLAVGYAVGRFWQWQEVRNHGLSTTA